MSRLLTLGIVLAGGKSRRMGQDKALLDIKGRSFVSNALNLLKRSNVDTVLLSGRGDDTFQYVLDEESYLGPASAMFNIMNTPQFSQFDRFVFVPVDMPLLTVDILNNLCTESRSCFYADHYLPCMLNRKDVQGTLHSKSVKGLLQQSSAVSLPINSNQLDCFENVNTPMEYDKVVI
tara:strand:- start:800 stop:1330 length:531 start_codon:yes stop_codon:yes gene_type:complete